MVAPSPNLHPVRMVASITAESELERELLHDPRLRAGLDWGTPRFGHPEGRVGDHVAAMLDGIPVDDPLHSELRFLALIHDSFKADVRPDEKWSPDNDHAMLARRFAEVYTSDERLLTTLERHDEPYWIWRHDDTPREALRPLLKAMPDVELFARFVELDAANEGKDLTFLWWFRRELAIAGWLPMHPAMTSDEEAEDLVYAKAFETLPEQQSAVARAATALVAEQRATMHADGEVFASDDGLRVVLQWHGHGSRRGLLEHDADVIRDAFAAHPVFANARAVEARMFHAAGS